MADQSSYALLPLSRFFDLWYMYNLPQCNYVRRVAKRSLPSTYVFLSRTWKWTISARHLLLSQFIVGYYLVGWAFLWIFCHELAIQKQSRKWYWAHFKEFGVKFESTSHNTCDPYWILNSYSRCLAIHAFWTLPKTCWFYASSCCSRYRCQRRPNSLLTCYP